jgi:hypothetical protein
VRAAHFLSNFAKFKDSLDHQNPGNQYRRLTMSKTKKQQKKKEYIVMIQMEDAEGRAYYYMIDSVYAKDRKELKKIAEKKVKEWCDSVTEPQTGVAEGWPKKWIPENLYLCQCNEWLCVADDLGIDESYVEDDEEGGSGCETNDASDQ